MNNLFITDGKEGNILDHINKKYIPFNEHEQDLPATLETFNFTTLGDKRFAEHLGERNGLIIPGEDGEMLEFRIFESIKYRDDEGLKVDVYSKATYLDLKKSKVFDPHKTTAESAQRHAELALAGTGWQIGEADFKGVRTLEFDNPFNPYDYLKRIAREFELELRFYVTHDGSRITGRYVDLVDRIGEWRGRTIEFGRDLQRIKRKENTDDVVTALWVYGPEREDGTRLKVFVEDEEARERWGINGEHLIDYYEPQTENQDITEERLETLGNMELEKRINSVVTYEANIVDLENVPGLENKKIRFGDTIRIKDTKFNPPLYLEARVFNVKRDVFNKSKKTVQLGDYREYTEEEVKALFRQMQAEIRRRLERLVLVSIISSAGNVFKNAQGETELTARTFVNGAERDEDGTLYDYQWMRFDKDGNHDTDFYAEGKTITVTANDIDEKATYRVLVAYELEVINTAEITISNVFDGEDGEQGPPGPKGEDGKTFYTWIKYADTPTSGMSDSPEGKEYIGIAYNKETPTPSTNYSDYVWSKFKGEQGVPGPPGEDGQPTYTWVKYADDEHGNGMSDSPDGKLYIGLAFNKTTPQESNNPADYTWSLMPQNIEIGGRNLLREGMFLNLIPSSSGQFTTYSTGRGFYIPVTSGEVYSLSRSAATNDRFRYCFSVEEPASGVEWSNMNTHDSNLKVENIVVPEGVNYLFVYIRYQTGELPNIKLEKGNKATDWTPAPEDVQEQIDEAKQEAEEAKQEAQQAKTTADGKNSVFTQSTAPPTAGRKIGDVWFDTSRDNLMHRFDGTQWVEAKWGEQSIVANSITANHIKSLVGLNVNDQFIVDSQGNVKFGGSLEGASGTFGEVTVEDGDFKLKDGTSGTQFIVRENINLLYNHSFELLKTGDYLEPLGQFGAIWKADPNTFSDFMGEWDNTKPEHARIVTGTSNGGVSLFGQQAIVLRGLDYGIYEQHVPIPSQYFVTKAMSLSAFVAAFEKTTEDVTVSIRLQALDSSGKWLNDLASGAYNLSYESKYDWQRVAVTFTGEMPSGTSYLRVRLLLVENKSSAMALCDGVQLVPYNHPTLYYPESQLYDVTSGRQEIPILNTSRLIVHDTATFAGHVNFQTISVHGQISNQVHSLASLRNGWENYGGQFQAARFTRTATRIVYLSGLIKGGLIGSYTAFTLPVGCRPLNTEIFITASASAAEPARIYIYPNGEVRVVSAGSNTWVSLSGIAFLAEN